MFVNWNLGIGIYLFLGAWNLEFVFIQLENI